MATPHLVVIANAAAGTGKAEETLAVLKAHFRSAGADAQLVLARDSGELAAAVERALGQRPQAVVAAGGDGTISSIAARLVGSAMPLGVLPLGTLNHFARDLHIPDSLEQAVRVVTAGHVVTVDVGEVNGRVFLNNSSLGIYPEIVRSRERQQRFGARKWPAFLRATLEVMRRNPFLNVRLSVDGKQLERRTPFVFVGNNEYCMEGFSMGERACLDDGKLNVYVTRQRGRLGLLRLAFTALFGTLREAKDLEVYTATEVRVDTRHRHVHVSADGEVCDMDSPLHYRIRPRALRVLVPAPAA